MRLLLESSEWRGCSWVRHKRSLYALERLQLG